MVRIISSEKIAEGLVSVIWEIVPEKIRPKNLKAEDNQKLTNGLTMKPCPFPHYPGEPCTH